MDFERIASIYRLNEARLAHYDPGLKRQTPMFDAAQDALPPHARKPPNPIIRGACLTIPARISISKPDQPRRHSNQPDHSQIQRLKTPREKSGSKHLVRSPGQRVPASAFGIRSLDRSVSSEFIDGEIQ